MIKLLPTRVYRSYYGGKNIDRINGDENPQITRFPEDWLASVTTAFNPGREIENEGLSQTEDGAFLRDLIEQNKSAMIGRRERMSLLFKMLDADERLVIQVHPTVEFAREHFHSPFGKTECWYILGDGGYVYLGFKPGITREKLTDLFEKQDTEGMLALLHRFPVKKGDFIFVAGGVPHAIGAGCFMAELQEPTDLMVIPERVTPSGISLPDTKLHGGLGFGKMFDCFVYEGMERDTVQEKYFLTPRPQSEHVRILADSHVTDKFRLCEITVNGSYTHAADSYGIVLITEGNGQLNGAQVKPGDRFFIPEEEKSLRIDGSLKLLFCQP